MTTAELRIDGVRVAGHPALAVDAGGPRVVVTTDIGPRILSVTLPDGTGEGLLASLPELFIDRPGWPSFQLHGGHRLWAGPETPETTYLPDDGPVTVSRDDQGVACSWLEPQTRLRRTIAIRPTADTVVVDHQLANEGASSATVTPWAITMCTPGGEAWIPRYMGPGDAHGVLPNGALVTWPYTRLSDERLDLRDPVIRLRAVAGAPGPCKVGVTGPAEWIAYRLAGSVLVKRAPYRAGATYPDMGASLQCYSGGAFLEIETLGPLTTLAPGALIDHRETWSLHAIDPDMGSDAVLAMLGLDQP